MSQEIGTKRRIGVDDQDGVELHSGCLQPVVEPVERGTLAGLRRIDAHVDVEAATAHDVVGAIGAVIGNHVNLKMIRWIVEVPEAVQRAADDRLLVVRGHQDRKSARQSSGQRLLVRLERPLARCRRREHR